MKVVPLVLCFLCVHKVLSLSKAFTNLKADLKKFAELTDAVEVILRHVTKLEARTINIITINDQKFKDQRDFKDLLLKKSSKKSEPIFKLEFHEEMQVIQFSKRRHCLFLAPNFEVFLKIYKNISSEFFKFNGVYIVVLLNGEIPEIKDILKLLWKIHIYNVLIVFEATKDSINVISFNPFTFESCSDTSPILVNTFENGSFVKPVMFSDKTMNDLKGCPIRISISNESVPYIYAKEFPSGSVEIVGEEMSLIKMLSTALNFRINFSYVGIQGFFYANGSGEGPLGTLCKGLSEISISNWWLRKIRLNFFDNSYPYKSDSIIFILPPGRDFTSLEKLIFPFSVTLWIVIWLCLIFGFVLIFLIRFQSKSLQSFVFGTKVIDPYLNMIAGIFGGSQPVLPRRNFARFLLTLFLLSSLVIRTLYQASYFKFLRTNQRHVGAQTIDAMIEQKYNFYTVDGAAEIFKSSKAIEER